MSYYLYILTLSLFTFTCFGYLLDLKLTKFFSSFAATIFNLATVSLILFMGSRYLTNNLNTTLLLITLVAVASSTLLYFYKMNVLVSFIAPFISLALILLPLFGGSNLPNAHTSGGSARILLYSHIILAVVGQTIAILSASIAAIYLVQFRSLKNRSFNSFLNNLPGLDKLSSMIKVSLDVGFLLLSLALLSGVIYTQFFWENSNSELIPKILWAVLIWLWYLACLWLTKVVKVKNLTLAKMSLTGFVLLAVGYFGVFADLMFWKL